MATFSKLKLLLDKLALLHRQTLKDDERDAIDAICDEMRDVLRKNIDFEEVVDCLDDSIFITDGSGKVIYVNPAYERNTGITPQDVLDRTVKDIVEEGKLFNRGAVQDVLKSGKKAFRLSTTYKTSPPRVGYAVGVPIYGADGNIKLVVASSRPILTLTSLREDYSRFLHEAKALTPAENIRIANEAPLQPTPDLVGASAKLTKIANLIEKAAPTDATILITGESGVGKEVVADEIFRRSNRTDKPYIKINCASIPRELLESELFGYEKGAFSGARASGKPGLFELANHGTLMLDEIGDMSLDLQAKLLRAIQNREITRIGGARPIPLDIRFMALTNSELKRKIANGMFRSDLFYRLSVVPLHIPPLRERREDLPMLCGHFIKIFAEKHGNTIQFTPHQISLFANHSWPGNVRELENVIEYLTICSAGMQSIDDEMVQGILDVPDMPLDATPPLSPETVSPAAENGDLTSCVNKYEKEVIERTLGMTKNLREAGAILNVNPSTLSRKIRQLGIEYCNARDSGRLEKR